MAKSVGFAVLAHVRESENLYGHVVRTRRLVRLERAEAVDELADAEGVVEAGSCCRLEWRASGKPVLGMKRELVRLVPLPDQLPEVLAPHLFFSFFDCGSRSTGRENWHRGQLIA